jgi:hypothetical protein
LKKVAVQYGVTSEGDDVVHLLADVDLAEVEDHVHSKPLE